MSSPVNSFQDLIVWQKAMALATDIYRVTRLLPKEELFGLTSQLRRAAVSIPSNIAEGQARNSPKEFLNFISIAKGSAAELTTQLDLCTRLGYLADAQHAPVATLAAEVARMLNALSAKIKAKLSPPPLTTNH
jgi:four helix bundle protein